MRYIGCKTLLLDNIKKLIDAKCKNATSFCDIFSGTSTVARYMKPYFEVYSNDVLFFSYCLQMATIENPNKPTFKKLSNFIKCESPIKFLNSLTLLQMEELEQEKRFFQNNYSPKGGRMYMTDSNALRIDYARNKVNEWKKQGLLSTYEYYYLVACIVEGIPFISNIHGTYGAFSKTWDKRTNKIFQLMELDVFENNLNNKCFNEEGVKLLERISGDILYIDPPYNERQYLPNYHLLETAAKYDNPLLKGITGQREYDKDQKSEFCSKRTVCEAFEKLIGNAKFKHIILSYNTDGIMSLSDIEKIMTKYGKKETFEINYIEYRRYKSKSNIVNNSALNELLIYIEKEVDYE